MRLRAPVPVLFACLFSAAPDAAAGRAGEVSGASVPPWLRQAAARALAGAGPGDVVWLHDELEAEPLAAGGVRFTRRVAARARRPEGLERIGSWSVPYRRGDEVVSVAGWSLGADGGASAARARDVIDRPYLPAASLFEDSRVRTVDIPGVAVGDVAGFEAVWVEATDAGMAWFAFGDPAGPTAFSRFAVRLPGGWSRKVVRLRLGGVDVEVEEDERAVVFTARDLGPDAPEPDGPPLTETLPRVLVRWWSPQAGRGFHDWDAVGRWYEELSRPVLGDLGEAAAIGERLRPGSPRDLLAAIEPAFRFAASEVRYVSIQIGIGGYRPHPPAEVCRTRYGDCKDKAFLLRALLGGWGLTTYPVLVRPRDQGRVVPEVASPAQFSHCIAAVALPAGVGGDLPAAREVEGLGRLLFLDPTESAGDSRLLPASIQGTLALVVHPGGGELVELPLWPPEASRVVRRLRVAIDEKGSIDEATLEESWSGSEAAARRGELLGRPSGELRHAALLALQERFPGAALARHEVAGLERPGEALLETAGMKGGRFGRSAGDLLVVEPGRVGQGWLGRSVNAEGRRTPLVLGVPREDQVEARVEPPAGLHAEELPAGGSLTSAELAASWSWSLEDGAIVYRRRAQVLAAEVPAERYPAFRVLVERLEREDGRGVVLLRRH